MELSIHTLTPLWTGSVKPGRMDRIHETGIIGSLRWWYEAIQRGLGYDVCDPTSEKSSADRCPRKRNGNDEYCSVCELFGSTGKRRQFRIRLEDGEALYNEDSHNIPIPSGRIHKGNRTGSWFLMADSITGVEIPFRVISLSGMDVDSRLRPILFLIDRHAAFGAKVSNGYGVLKFYENGQLIQSQSLNHMLVSTQPQRQHTLPDIRDFFFSKIQFQPPTNNSEWWHNIKGLDEALSGQVTQDGQTVNVYHGKKWQNDLRCNQVKKKLQYVVQNNLLPLAPTVRNWLRFNWNRSLSNRQKNYLFGTTQRVCPHCCGSIREDKYNRRNYWCNNCGTTIPKEQAWEGLASKINISHAYQVDTNNWEFRVWGWIPCRTPEGIGLNRDHFLSDLQATLIDTNTWQWIFNGQSPSPRLLEWHSLNCNQQDCIDYLSKLLGLDEGGFA